MKKSELDVIIQNFKEIKEFSDHFDYNSSSYINQRMMHIKPILEKEQSRLDGDVDVNCPMIMSAVVNFDNCDNWINQNIKKLVSEDYKILDFGTIIEPTSGLILAQIKYTN